MSITIVAIIPLYNGAAYIEQALTSIIDQDRPADEIIVVDDGSSDQGAGSAIVRRMQEQHPDLPIQLLSKPNGGQGSARNFGIRNSKSDLIALLDQDDCWYSDHLSKLAEPFSRRFRQELGWVYSNLDQVRSDGQLLNRSILNLINTLEHPKQTLSKTIGNDLFILPGASMFSRSAFDKVGGFNESLIGYEDDDFFLRLFMAGYTNIYINEALTKWRFHAASTSYSNKMARSRALYYDILRERFPDDASMGIYHARHLLVPRFVGTTIIDFLRGWQYGNVELREISRKQLRKFVTHVSPRLRLRIALILALGHWPLTSPRVAPYAVQTIMSLRSLFRS